MTPGPERERRVLLRSFAAALLIVLLTAGGHVKHRTISRSPIARICARIAPGSCPGR